MKPRILLFAASLASSLVPAGAHAQVDTVAIQVAALRMIWLDPELTHGAPVRCLGEWTPETGAAPVDPRPTLMARLARNEPPVVPRSRCGSPVEFWVDQPHEIGKTHARVLVSSRCGYTCGWSAECMVQLYRGSEWRASRCVMRGVVIKDPEGEDGAEEPATGEAGFGDTRMTRNVPGFGGLRGSTVRAAAAKDQDLPERDVAFRVDVHFVALAAHASLRSR